MPWMLTAVIIAEKTIPGSHRIARPLGVVMAAGDIFTRRDSAGDGVYVTLAHRPLCASC